MDFLSFFKKSTSSQVFDYLPDGLVLTNLIGRVLFVNSHAKELMNINEGDSLPAALDTTMNMIESLVENNIQSVFKVVKNDTEGYVELSASKIENEEKYVITARNVTQTHKFMKKMLVETESSKKVNRDKNTFLVKLSNELKSPLHSIDGFSKALLEGMGGEISDKQDKYLNIINKNAQELLYLTDKVLEQSKLEAGLYDWNYKHLDIVNILQLVARPYKEVLEEKNIEFTVDVDETLKRTCFADEMALRTVFDSLIDIAVKSTYLGNIKVSITHPELEYVASCEIECPEGANEKSFTQVTVEDTGSGMTEVERSFIFDPYYQLESGNKKNVAKSLSLAIDQSLIKQMRGKMWVESEAMQGTKFTFIIPNERLSV